MQAAIVLTLAALLFGGGSGDLVRDYRGYRYRVVTVGLNYDQAEARCHQYGGHLVHIKSSQLHSFVANMAIDAGRESCWIGCTDRQREGVWRWSDGSSLGYSNWDPGEPNDCCGGEDCGEMKKDSGFIWNDMDCMVDRRPLCQTEINECQSNNGGCDHNCVNTDGSYHCTCRTGYQMSGSGHCSDIDECIYFPCHVNATCTNTDGSFSCNCSVGYAGDGFNCADVDECMHFPCHDNATCTNTDGSFSCNCSVGYTGDGFNCADVDECMNFPCHDNATCTNTDGSFSCNCSVGYTGDGFNCADVDECMNFPCHDNATCTNTDGSFSCNCSVGYTGDGFNCAGA
ncbi:fibulin-1-like [Branchiostoma lanceolatum]|uniref:fibulin-1-like n=1 Tax=Branchiostoma lanceolatum TaxID=7740 RepID=UPI003455455F